MHVIHTREGHRPTSPTCRANKRCRSRRIGDGGVGIGDAGPCGRILVRGEPGWQIIDELAPIPGEVVLDKPGKGSFCATDLELILRTGGIRNLVLTGVTTDVCVAHDDARGQRPRLRVPDRRRTPPPPTDRGNHDAALKMVTMQGGVFGARGLEPRDPRRARRHSRRQRRQRRQRRHRSLMR